MNLRSLPGQARWLASALLATLILSMNLAVQDAAAQSESKQSATTQAAPTTDPIPSADIPEPVDRSAAVEIAKRLDELDDQIKSRQKALLAYRQSINGIPADQVSTGQKAELERMQNDLKNLQNGFEQIALGGLDITVLSPQPEKPYNWQAELLEVVRPVLASLKDLTDKPRRIEAVRQRIAQFDKKIGIADSALASLTVLQQSVTDIGLRQELKILENSWQERKVTFVDQLSVTQYQLAALLQDNRSNWEVVQESLQQFMAGRGLTLAIAVSAAVMIWLLIRLLVLLQRKLRRRTSTRVRRRRDRAMYYSSRLITGILMTLAILATFYLRSDVFLLAASILVLGALAVGLRHVLPRYYDEIRLLLDFGAVRESERLIHEGLPMQVREMGTFAILANPALKGFVRLPLSTLTTMISRPAVDEPWFPSKVGDFVKFEDGGVAQVVEQSVDVVVVRQLGALRNMSSSDFYATGLSNLSEDGFSVAVTFGIGYSHQAICLTEVPPKMLAAVENAAAHADWAEHCTATMVEFKEAAASSLDYLIVLRFTGAAANAYFGIPRLIQRTLVSLCNDNDWEIPFAQLTVHQAPSN